jgi:hypothetical protein
MNSKNKIDKDCKKCDYFMGQGGKYPKLCFGKSSININNKLVLMFDPMDFCPLDKHKKTKKHRKIKKGGK